MRSSFPLRSALPVAAFALATLAACGGSVAKDDTTGTATSTKSATTATTRPATSATTAAPATTTAIAAATAASGDDHVLLETTAGPILLDLYEDKTPKHAENFKKLAREGYFVDSPFHRVIEGFMAQGGGHWNPGGPGGVDDAGHKVPAEIVPGLTHQRGSLAAARQGDAVNPMRESSGSQFYICFEPAPFLDGQYTVFGEVLTGMENVDKITRGAPGSGAVDPAKATVVKAAKLVPAKAPSATGR